MSYKIQLTCLKSSFALISLLLLQSVSAQFQWSDLNNELEAKKKLLGTDLAVLIWKKDDTLIYKNELGMFNRKTSAPVGDASKWLTAALVMIFVDEGKISLEDKISRWIPEFARYGKNYITIRHCLSHYTGVADESGFLKKMFQKKKFMSLEEEVNSFASKEIRTNPGTDVWYGNLGFNIAGRVLEIISKKRFDVLIKQKLFNPLTMRRSSFTSMDGMLVNPSGGATCTADDYMKFLVMLLNNGSYGGKQILSNASVGELLKIHATIDKIKFAPKPASGFNYALGSWVLEEKDGKPIVFSSLGFTGTWPVIDLCKGYACLILPKVPIEEENTGIYTEVKAIIDEQMPATCK